MNPLELVGVLTPFFIIVLVLTKQLTSIVPSESYIAKYFIAWSGLLIFNGILIYLKEPCLVSAKSSLKVAMPVFIYIFYRFFINSKERLDGILRAILYSGIFPSILLLYEIIFSPFRISSRGSFVRYMGGYHDVVNIGNFILLCNLIGGYLYLEQMEKSEGTKKKRFWLIVLIGLSMIALMHINHIATFFTYAIILLLLFWHLLNFSSYRSSLIPILLIILFFISILVFIKPQKRFLDLAESEISVIEGEKHIDSAFHGRMGTWKRYWGYFTNDISLPEQFVGIIGTKRLFLVSSGTHNDYLRILFSSGYIGFTIYMLMIFQIHKSIRSLSKSQKFLIQGVLSIILLMSISTTPTLYIHINYAFFSIIAFIILPKKIRDKCYVKAKNSYTRPTPSSLYGAFNRH